MIKRLSEGLAFLSTNLKSVRLVAIGFAIAMCGAVADAHQQAKVFKIGWLTISPSRTFENYKKSLRALGHIEGKNIVIEFRSAEGKLDRLPAPANELVGLKADVIVAFSTTANLAAKNATQTIPIVFVSGGDPVAVGLIDSLARPGGNLTGFSNIISELAGKHLELLRTPFPSSPALQCCGNHAL